MRTRVSTWAVMGVIGLVLLLLGGCGVKLVPVGAAQSAPAHSSQWNQGYQAGVTIYQQASYMGTQSDKTPDNASLVAYCDQSIFGVEPQLPDLSQFVSGYQAGCYGEK